MKLPNLTNAEIVDYASYSVYVNLFCLILKQTSLVGITIFCENIWKNLTYLLKIGYKWCILDINNK